MSPRRTTLAPASVLQAVSRIGAVAGAQLREARVRRGWTVRELARRGGVSASTVLAAENGTRVSLEAYAALAEALGQRLELGLVDPRSRTGRSTRSEDPIHATMAEMEAAHLRRLGHDVAIDEPYQHYQFAGRADLLAWDLGVPALLHLENRTRFPNVGETAGSFNAKRAYLPGVIATRLGIRGWQSVTNVIVALWSAEVLHVLRLRSETFRVLCPDELEPFIAWWSGRPVPRGDHSTLVVLDPLASGRSRPFIGLGDAQIARPRVRGYAEAVERLRIERRR